MFSLNIYILDHVVKDKSKYGLLKCLDPFLSKHIHASIKTIIRMTLMSMDQYVEEVSKSVEQFGFL